MPTCEICGQHVSDQRKVFGRHLWSEHHITPDDYRVRHLGTAPECRRPGCTNPVPRHPGGGWFKCCSPPCAVEMEEDIPLVRGGWGGPSRPAPGELRAMLRSHIAEKNPDAFRDGIPSYTDPDVGSSSPLDELPDMLKNLVLLCGFAAAVTGGILAGRFAADAWSVSTVLAVVLGVVAGLLAGFVFVRVVGWFVIRLYRLFSRRPWLLVLIVLGGAAAIWQFLL